MKTFAVIIAVIFGVIFLAWGGVRTVRNIIFVRNCGGYLKRAADANTIQLAAKQLEVAVGYIEKEGLTNGYTSIIYRTPDEDVGFWYSNLKSSLVEIQTEVSKGSESSPLEKSNMLIKLRETLLDHAESGEHVTIPGGISVFPSNMLFCLWGCLSALLFVAGVGWYMAIDYY